MTSNRPFISILTPTHNRADFLPKLLNSLRAQTFKDFEWVIANDGSIDESHVLIKSYMQSENFKITYIHSSLRVGKSKMDNLLLDNLNGKYIFWCDSDDYLTNNALEIIKNKIISLARYENDDDFIGLFGINNGTDGELQTHYHNNFVPSEGEYLWQDLEKNVSSKTKWLMLNSPSNPTGSMYTKEELMALGEVLKKHDHVYVLSDDIYEKIVYDGNTFHTIAEVCPFLYDRTLTMNGLSKSYCMTGWRVGYAAGPTNVINAMNKVQSQNVSSTASISMAASVEALTGDQSFITSHNESFLRRRDLVVKNLNETPGLSCRVPEGAFYVFASCKGVLGKKTESGKIIEADGDFMDYLLEEVGVAGVQGSAFGLDGFFRISYATSDSILEDACQRIKSACSKLS